MVTARWNRAQIAEKRFWLQNRPRWSIQNSNRYWRGILEHGFNLDYKHFEGKSILEVGCGPAGIIFELDNSKFRAGLEPMDLEGLINDSNKKLIVKKGIGEEMPFEDGIFDIVVSFNALDHSSEPAKVIREVHRVLGPNGELLLWIYVLQEKYRFLRRMLNGFDKPHPHHFTKDDLAAILENYFDILYYKEEEGTGLPNNTVKKAIANQMMKTLWTRSKKKTQLA
jgi:SAM-dependent methyltransferase